MYYYMKTDVGPADYLHTPFRKGHYFGLVKADSLEEAEVKFKSQLGSSLTGDVFTNRKEAARRLANKNYEVAEYFPEPGDPAWKARLPLEDTR